MVNLLKFRPDGSRASYARNAQEVAPHLQRVGGTVRYVGSAPTQVIDDGERSGWDAILVVEYPSPAAFIDGALHLEDILARRMRISIEYPHCGVDCAHEVAEVVAPLLGWSAEDVDREVNTYIVRVDAEVRSQQQPDDESADALRAAAPEARGEILEPVPLN